MKICPNCRKSNPDNSKKCFFCGEDISLVPPYIQEPEETEPEETEPEEEEEETEASPKEKKPPFKIKIQFPKPKSPDTIAAALLPVSAILIFLAGIFISVCALTYFMSQEKLLEGVMVSLSSFVLSAALSVFALWLGAILKILKDHTEKNSEKK